MEQAPEGLLKFPHDFDKCIAQENEMALKDVQAYLSNWSCFHKVTTTTGIAASELTSSVYIQFITQIFKCNILKLIRACGYQIEKNGTNQLSMKWHEVNSHHTIFMPEWA